MLLALQSLHLSILLTRWLLGCSCKPLSSPWLMQKAFYCLDDVSALCGNLRTYLEDPGEKAQLVTCLKQHAANPEQGLRVRDSPCSWALQSLGISHSCPGTG